MVEIKAAASVLIASAAIAPALAYSLNFEVREDNKITGSAFSRRFARELNDELLERDPLFGINHIKKWTGLGRSAKNNGGASTASNTHGTSAVHHGAGGRGRHAGLPSTASDSTEGTTKATYQHGTGGRGRHGAPPSNPTFDDELHVREPMFGINHIKKWTGHVGAGGYHDKHAAVEATSTPTDASSQPREYYDDLD